MRRLTSKQAGSEPADILYTVHSFITHPKENFPKIFRLCSEQHLYWNEWAKVHWDHYVLENLVEIMKRFELNDLQFHGKTVYLCTMMLQYGFDSTLMPADCTLFDDLMEALLRIMLQFPVYHSCFALLDVLVTKYDVPVKRVFEIGCTITDQLPVILNDDNYIALLHFAAVYCNKEQTPVRDLDTVEVIVKFLAHVSGHIVGEFKSNFFLEKCFPMFDSILRLRPRDEGHGAEDDVLWYSLRLLRIIASVHPRSNEVLATSPLLSPVFAILKDPCSTERCLRESIVLVNTLVGGNPQVRENVKRSHLSLGTFSIISRRKLMASYDMLVELFLSLYEADLPFDDKRMVYQLPEHSEFYATVETLLSDALSVVSAELAEAASEAPEQKTPALEFFARALDKLERSLQVISNPRHFRKVKTSIVQLLSKLFVAPDELSVQHIAAMDVAILLLKGSGRCWRPHEPNPLDNEFLNLSQRLVEDFHTFASNEKIFDKRDRNSLNYLAGSDHHTDIPDIVASHGGQSTQEHVFSMLSFTNKAFSFNANITPQPQPVVNMYNTPSMNAAIQSSMLAQSLSTLHVTAVDRSEEQYLRDLHALLTHAISQCALLISLVTRWEHHSLAMRVRQVRYLYLVSNVLGWETLQHFIPGILQLPQLLLGFLVEERFQMKSRLRKSAHEHHIQIDDRHGHSSHISLDPAHSELNPLYNTEKMIISVLTGLVDCVGTFDQAMDYGVYLTKIITSKPDGLATDGHTRHVFSEDSEAEGGSRGELTDEHRSDLPPLMRSSSMGAPRLSVFMDALDHMDLHYAALSSLITLSVHDKGVRRRLVGTVTEIVQSLFYFSPVDPVNYKPVLHLIFTLAEFLYKVEINAEEALVSVIIRALRHPLAYNKAHACECIYAFGVTSPGFVYRGLSRLEVEDELCTVFEQQGISSRLSCPRLLLSALKAYSQLAHNVNLKPVWLPLPWLYPHTAYVPTLKFRKLLRCEGIALLLQVLRFIATEYRLCVFTYILGIGSSLMYACVDDMLRPVSEDDATVVQDLKDMLVQVMLPWLPIAMDFITLGKKKKKQRENSDPAATPAPIPASVQPPSGTTPQRASAGSQAEHAVVDWSTLDHFTVEATSDASAPFAFKMALQPCAPAPSIYSVSAHASAFLTSIHAVEALTEKTMEALYAFLCTDALIPLSTYLSYIHIFDRLPLIACVCYFMTENKHNVKILARGMNFIKHFAENQASLSIIAMHAPPALLAGVVILKDSPDVNLTFCKIMLTIARMDDDFARENLVRFKVYLVLSDMIKVPHHLLHREAGTSVYTYSPSPVMGGVAHDHGAGHSGVHTQGINVAVCYFAVQTLNAILDTQAHVKAVCRQCAFLADVYMSLLDALPKEMVLQFVLLEGLIKIDAFMPELVSQSARKNAYFAIMRRARRNILTLRKVSHSGTGGGGSGGGGGHGASSGVPTDIEEHRLQATMDHPVWKSVGCVIS